MMANWLHEHLPKKLSIVVSPSERTQMTAHALGMPFEVKPKVGIGAVDLLGAAGWPDHSGATLIVGHQPTLGRVAALLLAGAEANWTVKKGGLWWFSNRTRDGKTQTVLRAVIGPDLL